MKISYNWLKTFFNTLPEPAETASILTQIGLEVESIETTGISKDRLNGLLVAQVVSCIKHPQADRLTCTQIDDGSGQLKSVVCGAPNVAEGQFVVFAPVGCTLYPKNGDPFTIKKSKIRGAISEGMLCAEDEIGIGNAHDGIVVLNASGLKPGNAVSEILAVNSDTCFEIGITPNRGDALSHYGVARDLAAALSIRQQSLQAIRTIAPAKLDSASKTLQVNGKITSTMACDAFHWVIINGISHMQSPDWLQQRLNSIGVKSINAVVDVTNFLMHEWGQPLHAYDFNTLEGAELDVRNAQKGEQLVALDGNMYTLDADDLIIADAQKPLALAGIIGGTLSSVTHATTTVVIECALFKAAAVRRTSKRHAIHTDASYRFERGVNPLITTQVISECVRLICEITGAQIAQDIQSLNISSSPEKHPLAFSYKRCFDLIGMEIPKSDIRLIFESLGFLIESEGSDGILLHIPASKSEIKREADVVEEIMRLYGYDKITASGHIRYRVTSSLDRKMMPFEHELSTLLQGSGWHEMMNLSFEPNLKLNPPQIVLKNPLSHELSALRTQMLYGALKTLSLNKNHRNSPLRFFEWGSVYTIAEQSRERKTLALVCSGEMIEANPYGIKYEAQSGYLKAVLEQILNCTGLTSITQNPFTCNGLKNAFEILYHKTSLGYWGIVNSEYLNYFDITGNVYYAELDAEVLLEFKNSIKPVFTDFIKFPFVERDISIQILETISFDAIKRQILKCNTETYIQDVRLFDRFKKAEMGSEHALGIRIKLQSADKTLTDSEIDIVMQRIIEILKHEFSCTLR